MNSDNLVAETKQRMQKAVEHLKEELSSIRTGRASPALLETLKVDAYRTRMDLRDLASINAPEPRLLVVQVWDQANIGAIEKAIRESDLAVNPVSENNQIKVPIPPLSEERRREMIRLVGEKTEATRVAIRAIRHEAIGQVEAAEKKKEVSEDEKFRQKGQLQKLTDEFSQVVELAAKAKEKELLEV